MAKTKKQKTETEEIDTAVTTELREADANGNRFIPGMEQEVKVIPELREAIKHEKLDFAPRFQAAQKALSVQKEVVKELVERYKSEFFRDEASGVLVYDDGEVKITVQEKDVVSYEVKKESE